MAGRHRRSPEPGRHRKPPQRAHVVVPALAVAAVLGVGGVAGAALSSGGGSHQAPTPSATESSGVAARTAPSTSPTRASAGAAPTAVLPTSTTLPDFSLTVVRSVSWVEVVGPGGRRLYQGLLRRGHTLVYRQRPLLVTIGDAGVVRIVAHHHALPGRRRGTVLRFTYR